MAITVGMFIIGVATTKVTTIAVFTLSGSDRYFLLGIADIKSTITPLFLARQL